MTKLDLDKLSKLCEAATPDYRVDDQGIPAVLIGGQYVRVPTYDDMLFIAAARTAVPELIASLSSANAEVERLRNTNKEQGEIIEWGMKFHAEDIQRRDDLQSSLAIAKEALEEYATSVDYEPARTALKQIVANVPGEKDE